jgi:Tol biopolymer transport system component
VAGHYPALKRLLRTVAVVVIASALLALAPGSAAERSVLQARGVSPERSDQYPHQTKGQTAMRTASPVIAVLTVLGTTATVALATAPGKNGRLVFRRYLDPGRTTGALFTANPDGSNVRQVTRPRRGVIDQEADWSPNGRMIAFERRLPCPAAGRKNGLDNTCTLVYTMKRDGKALKPLATCDFGESCHGVHTPAWSPAGSKIAFRLSLSDSRYVESFNLNAGIWIANADGSDRRQITQVTPGASWDSGPQWSPDGTKLVFVRADLERKADAVFTVNVDGTALFQVTPWDLNGGDGPDWSPDGKWLLFRSGPKDGSSNVYKSHPDGSGLTNLTRQRPSGFHYLSSSFSPDGRMITTARTPGVGREGAADVFVMNANGSKLRPVTQTRLWESAADWGSRR